MKNYLPVNFLWILIFLGGLLLSGLHPKDRFTWFLEVVPAIIGGLILLATRKRFPLTSLLYILILVHCLILMVGGHYTYAEVPFFNDLQAYFGPARNNFDKVGHFFQGFVPALIAREILIRKEIVRGQSWLKVIVVSICLAISAFYELIEWWVALATGEGAEAFLGTQGYIWDTQSDMGYALMGALVAIFFVAQFQDRQMLAFLGTQKQ